jgi:elongation factor Ts
MVNELRTKSGAGIMDCKNALKETDGDMEKAMEALRKKGAAVAAKRADRSASEGVIYTIVSDNKASASIVEVNCETDFVAKSDDFVNFAKDVMSKAFAAKANSVDELLAAAPELAGQLNDVVGKVGEKSEISRVATVSVENGLVVDYIHPGNKIAAVVVYANVSADNAGLFAKTGRDIAIQVAAMKPVSVSRKDIGAEVIAKELEIYREQARNEGKPENVLDRIANGRLEKYYQEACLLEQTFFKDQSNARTIAQLIDEFNKQNGAAVSVQSFILYLLGGSKK